MVFIEAEYCTKVEQACLKLGQYTRPSHPAICEVFAEERTCVGTWRRQRFCIDRYEFPNAKGAHPPSMISAWDSAAMCRRVGKRLCWDSEWTIACEGTQQRPFPYGTTRDSAKCHHDTEPIRPVYRNMDPSNPALRDRELTKLDQSVPSGSKPECVSDFGVYDLTGNFDEWTFLEKPQGQSTWAATKGGWWGRYRNACRPNGVGHPESFIFFPVSTRCCADPDPAALPPTPAGLAARPLWTPPPPPRASTSAGDPDRGWVPPRLRGPQAQ